MNYVYNIFIFLMLLFIVKDFDFTRLQNKLYSATGEKPVRLQEELQESDYINFCNTYHDIENHYLYEYKGLVDNTVECELILDEFGKPQKRYTRQPF